MDGRAVLGTNIKRFRLALEVSQEALADRAGMDRTYVAAVERAEVNISIDNICRLAWALERSVAEMVRPQLRTGKAGTRT